MQRATMTTVGRGTNEVSIPYQQVNKCNTKTGRIKKGSMAFQSLISRSINATLTEVRLSPASFSFNPLSAGQ